MAKMTSQNWCERLAHLAKNRISLYVNSFPGNCGLIGPDGLISFDCIGMVKSVINEPDIVYKTAPQGYYVTPGKVIPDTTEKGILDLCTDVKWYDFSNMTPGEYLYMDGHAGVYIGEYGDINVVECTAAWTTGCVFSYVDAAGNRFQHKGGPRSGAWSAHGKLTRYIDYNSKPQPAKSTVTYRSFDLNKGLWLPEVTSDHNVADTAGIPSDFMGGLAVKVSTGTVKYCVHNTHDRWLPPVTGYDINDFWHGYAGNGNSIDGIAIYSDKVKLAYRVKLQATQEWLEWVKSDDYNLDDPEYGFAGILGHAIDEIEIKVI